MTNPTKSKRRFTAQQKQEAVELCLTEGLTCTAVAQRLGLPNSSLAIWVQQARIDQGQHGSRDQGPPTSEERAELSRMRKEIRELRREKDFSGLRQRTTASGPLGYASSMQRAAAFEMVCLISLVLDCFSVAWLCMQLGVVGRSGFYGAPRVHQELRASGLQLGRHRIARLMSCTAFMAKSLLKNPAISAKIGQPPSPDARSPGEQRLPVLLRVDRGADSGQSSAAADPETGGSGP